MAERKQAEERRQHPRVMVRVLVDFESANTYLYDYSTNLSEGGIFIETQKPAPVGSALTLRFTLPNIDRVFKAEGKVAWHKPSGVEMNDTHLLPEGPGMGVEFVRLEDADRELVRNYVDQIAQKR